MARVHPGLGVPGITASELFAVADAFGAIARDGARTLLVGLRLQKALAALHDHGGSVERRRPEGNLGTRGRLSLQDQEDIMTDTPRETSPPTSTDTGTTGQDKVREIGQAARKAEADTSGDAREAIDRATAPNGQAAGE